MSSPVAPAWIALRSSCMAVNLGPRPATPSQTPHRTFREILGAQVGCERVPAQGTMPGSSGEESQIWRSHRGNRGQGVPGRPAWVRQGRGQDFPRRGSRGVPFRFAKTSKARTNGTSTATSTEAAEPAGEQAPPSTTPKPQQLRRPVHPRTRPHGRGGRGDPADRARAGGRDETQSAARGTLNTSTVWKPRPRSPRPRPRCTRRVARQGRGGRQNAASHGPRRELEEATASPRQRSG